MYEGHSCIEGIMDFKSEDYINEYSLIIPGTSHNLGSSTYEHHLEAGQEKYPAKI